MSLIKCKKCNSANVKVDFNQVYTSIPAMYGYICQDCGEDGYVDCGDVNMNDFTSEGFQRFQNCTSPNINFWNIEDKKEPKAENNGGLLGWICPKCGRCYSPFTDMCTFCNNNDITWETWKITC